MKTTQSLRSCKIVIIHCTGTCFRLAIVSTLNPSNCLANLLDPSMRSWLGRGKILSVSPYIFPLDPLSRQEFVVLRVDARTRLRPEEKLAAGVLFLLRRTPIDLMPRVLPHGPHLATTRELDPEKRRLASSFTLPSQSRPVNLCTSHQCFSLANIYN